MMKVKELLIQGSSQLENSCTETPMLDAELLLIHAFRQNNFSYNKVKLFINHEEAVDDAVEELFLKYVKERKLGKPVQYITNTQEFMGMDFYVSEDVLIPRGDTEVLVEKVLELAKPVKAPHILDLCTGSGAIAISLALNIGDSKVYASDISQKALECARINARRLGVSERVEILEGDLFKALEQGAHAGAFDIIVSNPPYIPKADIEELKPNVREYEPLLALDGGMDGLDFYRRIIQEAALYLKDGGILAFEIGYNQGHEVERLMKEMICPQGANIEKDYSGLNRCVWGVKKSINGGCCCDR